MKLLIFWSAFCATKLFPAKKEVLYNIVKADDKYIKSVRTRVCCFTDKELLYKSERKAKRLRIFNPSRSTVVKRRLQTFFQSLPQRLSSTLHYFFHLNSDFYIKARTWYCRWKNTTWPVCQFEQYHRLETTEWARAEFKSEERSNFSQSFAYTFGFRRFFLNNQIQQQLQNFLAKLNDFIKCTSIRFS